MPGAPEQERPLLIEIRAILLGQTSCYPLWVMEDIYKLTTQSPFGSEHAEKLAGCGFMASPKLRLMGAGSDEPHEDPVITDGFSSGMICAIRRKNSHRTFSYAIMFLMQRYFSVEREE